MTPPSPRPPAGAATGPPERCGWCGGDPLYVAYHDQEWAVPERDDEALFAKLILDGFQAGLSWLTILRRRAGILAAFDGLRPDRVARFSAARRQQLLADARIIRHRGKVDAAIANARAYLRLREAGVGFAAMLWAFVDGQPLQGRWPHPAAVPSRSRQSEAMARALGQHGFAFCGPTICYAFMQATGMVNDHWWGCFRRVQVAALGRSCQLPAMGTRVGANSTS